MADEHWIDGLSRDFARGVTRKDFLRLLGGTLIGAAVQHDSSEVASASGAAAERKG
jgi:hypothetical protein